MKIVLFDIDGTILRSDGAGRAAMVGALREVFGSTGPDNHRYDGKTDKLIVREAMRSDGFDDSEIDRRMDDVMERYVALLQEHLGQEDCKPFSLPGVEQLIDAVEESDDMLLGLLTGNVVSGARAKLGAVSVDFARFRVGAFGSDHEDRPMLPPVARSRASSLLGYEVKGEQLVIIGDTPADIHCGRAEGARAIAVATGTYDLGSLEEHSPAAAFSDLSNTVQLMETIRSV